MSGEHWLYLHEEILLLVMKDREGTVESGACYSMAMGGAILAELMMEGRLGVHETRKSKLAEVLDTLPFGEPLMDECLRKVATARRRASLQTWVGRFAGVKNLKHRVARQLCNRGILRADEDKVLLLFKRKIYPEVNPEPERDVIRRLEEAIFTDTEDVDPRTVVLVSLAHSAGLLKYVFDKKELKRRKARIEKVANGELAGKATADAIAAMQAAVAAAVIASSVVVTTTVVH